MTSRDSMFWKETIQHKMDLLFQIPLERLLIYHLGLKSLDVSGYLDENIIVMVL